MRRAAALGALSLLIASFAAVAPVAAADQNSGGFVVFAKSPGGSGTVHGGGKQVDVSGSGTSAPNPQIFDGSVHSNHIFDVGGSHNRFNGPVTYVTSANPHVSSQFAGSGPTQVGASANYPGSLEGYAPSESLCTIGNFSTNGNIDASSAPDGSVVCRRTGTISFSSSAGGTRVISFFTTLGLIDVSAQGLDLQAAADRMLAYSGTASDVAIKVQSSNGSSDGILFAPNGWVYVSGQSWRWCSPMIGQQVKVPTSTSIFQGLGCTGASNPPASDPPASDPPASDPPASDPPASDPPASDPPASDPPASDPPASDPPASDPPASDPPASDPPASDPPSGNQPASDPPASDPPASDPPASDPPSSIPPGTNATDSTPPAGDPPGSAALADLAPNATDELIAQVVTVASAPPVPTGDQDGIGGPRVTLPPTDTESMPLRAAGSNVLPIILVMLGFGMAAAAYVLRSGRRRLPR